MLLRVKIKQVVILRLPMISHYEDMHENLCHLNPLSFKNYLETLLKGLQWLRSIVLNCNIQLMRVRV
jgi:hypothetical protein